MIIHNGIAEQTKKKKKVNILIKRLAIYTTTFLLLTTSQVIFPQSNDDCLACHSDETLTMEKGNKEVSIFVNENVFQKSVHAPLECVACHTGFNPDDIPHKENITAVKCTSCHEDAPALHKFHPQMLKSGTRSAANGTSCKSCHGEHDISSPSAPKSKWQTKNLAESCGKCHSKIKENYLESNHSIAFQKNVKGAPTCINCHVNPLISGNTTKDTLKTKIAQEQLCLSCHLDDPSIIARTAPSAGFITAYEKSVHGAALTGGNTHAAGCIDCHGEHDIIGPEKSSSPVFKLNIPTTCGKCHQQIAEEYKESIHGQLIAKGNTDAPVCTDCHGEHNILNAKNPASPVSFKNLSEKVCAPCHSSVKLAAKYELDASRFKTFNSSYHGLAIRGGSTQVANCASCHGVHNIKPSSDSTSTISKANLVKTCGTCHPGANQNFTIGRIHVDVRAKQDEPILYWVSTTYITLIILTIGAMFFHNLLDFFRKAKIHKMKQRGLIKHEPHGHALYLRMTLSERIQHATMALSFIVLVITGFMLRYPDSWWVTHIRDLSQDTFQYRSIIHRVAAVIMVAVSLFHIYYLSFTARGRKLVFDLLPRFQDLKDAIGVVKFNLGISKEKPKLDRFSYIEKAEYWALVWGTMVMTATGFILWFDNTFIGLLTKLGWDVARTIHYYEAWLAWTAIVVWHFYFVIFNPDIYPMNLAWLKGTISEEEMADEHPLELERLKKKEYS
ncbi:MAG: cytochrome b/b6 domain-containing protein, partial [Ignavibacteriaceae bacterium]|nr:cytochrome b/b6 domain-containing protein [Ignavibacteriaceae bacterium]